MTSVTKEHRRQDRQVLGTVFASADLCEELTVREYLLRLLATLWEEDEGFSGKRPFGNSGWKVDLAAGLVRAGLLSGTFDEDDEYLDWFDEAALDELITNAIKALGAH